MYYAYVIQNQKMDLFMTVLDIDTIHLHEEVIPAALKKLTQSIKLDGCLRHPIITDRESLVVLDGMHRVAALRKLGCNRIPVCLVEYENPAITVGCWYRTLKGTKVMEHVEYQAEQAGFFVEKSRNSDVEKLGTSPFVAAVKNRKRSFLIGSPFKDLKESYDNINLIEEGLKKQSVQIGYETELDSFDKLSEKEVDAILLTPKPSKSSVIGTALSGRVFTFKTTRHVIPARPLYLNVPLNLLQSDEKPLKEVNQELKRMLDKRGLKHLAAGSVLEGRRYEEDLYLFVDLTT